MTAPTDRVYVNTAAPVAQSGKGTSLCPYRTFHEAFAAVPTGRTTTFKICTQGILDETTEGGRWPLPSTGNGPGTAESSYLELDGTYCGGSSTRTVVHPPSVGTTMAVQLKGPTSFHGYDLQTSDSVPEGIDIDGTRPVEITEVSVQGFMAGIEVKGDALIGAAVSCTMNAVGLDVQGQAAVEVTDATAQSSFSNNEIDGISSTGTLVLQGAAYMGPDATGLDRTIVVSGNRDSGISAYGPQTAIDFVAISGSGAGIATTTGTTLKLTNSVLTKNVEGMNVNNAGGNDVSTFNLGTAPSGLFAGNNHIFGNTDAGVCLFSGGTGTMPAMGNVWSSGSSKDCTGTPTGKLTHMSDCSQPVDVAFGSERMDVSNCSFE